MKCSVSNNAKEARLGHGYGRLIAIKISATLAFQQSFPKPAHRAAALRAGRKQ
jgi:hypothetical protein